MTLFVRIVTKLLKNLFICCLFGINKLSLELNDSTKHLTIFAELDGLVYKMIVIGRFVVGLLIIIIIGLYLKKLTCATYDKNK